MPFLCTGHGGPGYIPVERDEAAAALDGQGEQVRVRKLAMPKHVGPIERARVEQAPVGGPEFVGRMTRGLAKPFRYLGCPERAGIARLGHDADAAILRQGVRAQPLPASDSSHCTACR